MNIAERYAFALDLVREAGAWALGHYNHRDALKITAKGLQDMATQADLETELLIRERLAEAFPDDGFLGEETGATAFAMGQGIWVVDPIDGTQPFISGMSAWCVSIAFIVNDEIKFGAVFAPARHELFAGGIGIPATLNGKPIHGHASVSLADGILGIGLTRRVSTASFLKLFEALLDAGAVFYREGSGALALCYVANGRLIGYVEQHINSWDCLAGIAIVRAAGLQTSDYLTAESLRRGGYLIAGNAEVYQEIARLFSEIGPGA